MESRSIHARRSDRNRVAMTAKLRANGGRASDVAVTDLSAGGCCVAKHNIGLRSNQRVTIKLESIESKLGLVKWSVDSAAGIEFERPLYGPVAEHLQRSFVR